MEQQKKNTNANQHNNRKKSWRKKKRRGNRPRDGMQAIILDLARVTRVQKGGKRLRFRVCIGVGDKKGTVGIGISKGTDVATAVKKATRSAKKHTIKLPLTKEKSIPHTLKAHYKAGKILLKPAPVGTGIKAGGVIRTLCDLAGIENITAKILGTNNKVTNAKTLMTSFDNFFSK